MKKFEYLEIEPSSTSARFKRGLQKSLKGGLLSSNAKPLIDKIVGTFLISLSASASKVMPVNEKIIAPRHIYAALRMIDFDDFIPILQRSEENEKKKLAGKKRERKKMKEEKEEEEKKVRRKEKDSEDESENESEEGMEEDEKKENPKTKGKGREQEKDLLKLPSPKKFKIEPNSDEDEESNEYFSLSNKSLCFH